MLMIQCKFKNGIGHLKSGYFCYQEVQANQRTIAPSRGNKYQNIGKPLGELCWKKKRDIPNILLHSKQCSDKRWWRTMWD